MSLSLMHKRRSVTARGVAVLAASALVLTACGSDDGGDDPTTDEPAAEDTGDTGDAPAGDPGAPEAGERDLTLKIGTQLPQTGTLAYLGPPEEAGVMAAAKEINDADLGITVEVTYADSGDADNKAFATTVPQLLSAGVNVIVGAASSGVSKLFIDDVTGAGVLMISPANTSPDFTTWNDNGLYWRTAPSDLLQGEVLGNLIAEDGAETLAFFYLNDAYGTGLEKVTSEVYTAAGGEVVASEAFNAGDTTFDAQISAITAANPDALALITFDEAETVIPALVAGGFDASKLYLVDGNLTDYSDTLDPGVLEGAKGTQPGPALEADFEEAVNGAWTEAGNDDLEDWNYAAESYDAVMLTALAALAANSVEGAEIATYMQQVSGGSGEGEKYTTFADAAAAIVEGNIVDYDGPSGPITFDENGDPTEATIGIYQYGPDNTHERIN